MELLKRVAQLEDEMRGFLTHFRRQTVRLRNRAVWYKICSCLDVIGDTELALDAYLQSTVPTDTGIRYLHLYGAFQALILQQDAVQH